MTLILAAICKNGICICADKRCTEKFTNGTKKISDKLHKIYLFQQYPVAIYNHGINKFDMTTWRDLCNDFEKNNTQSQNFDKFCETFRGSRNMLTEFHSDFCGHKFVFPNGLGSIKKFWVWWKNWKVICASNHGNRPFISRHADWLTLPGEPIQT
jgi:hypothetical protein